jgi:hypothetical protein
MHVELFIWPVMHYKMRKCSDDASGRRKWLEHQVSIVGEA